MIRTFVVVLLITTLQLPLAVPPLSAQDAEEGDTVPEGIGEDAAEALGEDRGQTEEEQLEQILSSQENEYDLINEGNVKINYSFSYSVNSSIRPQQRVIPDTQGVTAFNLTTDSQHNATHRVSFRYGFLNNLTLGMNLPIVTKWNTTTGEATGDLGDVTLTSRIDPFVTRPGQLSTTLFGNLSLPTGRSPWEVNQQEELSTGSGGVSIGGGVNVSKTVDPVVAFGSFNVNYGFPITGLNQARFGGQNQNRGLLREVRPGPNFSFGAGMAYSLSYDVSLTFSLNYGLGLPTELEFDSGQTAETAIQPSGTLSMSSGWRLGPEYITNIGVGIGLTRNSPDMSFNVSFPLLLDTPAF